ncbi:MAG: hypothetical protein V5804_12055 [Mucilaginibacter sp.]|uniref:hypothetical protein n=1 Tax=Mucilaginibacter sp. TaxID=1882438 RepID=UPI0034E4DCC8
MMKQNKINYGLFVLNPSESKNSIFKKLDTFLTFKKGWHYGEGEIFNIETIDRSKNLCFYLYNMLFTSIDVFPGFDGEVLIKIYFLNSAVEIFVKNDNKFHFSIMDKEDNDLYQSDILSIEGLKKELIHQRTQWSLSEFYPYTIMKQKEKDSTAWPLGVKTEYPLLIQNVQLNCQVERVAILETISQNTPILQCISNSVGTYYQIAK